MLRHRSCFLVGEIYFLKYNLFLLHFICFYMFLDFENCLMKRLENETEKLICFPKQAKLQVRSWDSVLHVELAFYSVKSIQFLFWNGIMFFYREFISSAGIHYLWRRSLEHNFWISAIFSFGLSCRVLKICQLVHFDSWICSCGYWALWIDCLQSICY